MGAGKVRQGNLVCHFLVKAAVMLCKSIELCTFHIPDASQQTLTLVSLCADLCYSLPLHSDSDPPQFRIDLLVYSVYP